MTFEQFVESYTGRDMAYHCRNKTTGLEFARACWNEQAAEIARLTAERDGLLKLLRTEHALRVLGSSAFTCDDADCCYNGKRVPTTCACFSRRRTWHSSALRAALRAMREVPVTDGMYAAWREAGHRKPPNHARINCIDDWRALLGAIIEEEE